MTSTKTLFAVLGIVLTGEPVAEFLASHSVLLGFITCVAFFGLFYYCITRPPKHN